MTTAPLNTNVTLRFPPKRVDETGTELEESYQLLELPPEILKEVDKSQTDVYPLTIKGTLSDDAVLCTPTTTFLLRTITLSNSLLICRTPDETSSADASSSVNPNLEIRGIEHQILECMPQAADLERIRRLLKDSQWGGMEEEIERPSKRRKKDGKRWTRAQLESVVQASPTELEKGLKDRNVIEVDGYMTMLPSTSLRPLLVLILTLLTIHATQTDLKSSRPMAKAPLTPIENALVEDHEVSLPIVRGVVDLFGEVDAGEWTCNVQRMVQEVGKAMLAVLPGKGKPLDTFLSEWKTEVGESWAECVDINLLQGNYLLNDPPVSTLINPSQIISYFPRHLLPLHAPTRFADLFLTRQKWKPKEMTPFLDGLTRDGDKKALDKLIAKFVRVVKEKEGTWWYPRRTG